MNTHVSVKVMVVSDKHRDKHVYKSVNRFRALKVATKSQRDYD